MHVLAELDEAHDEAGVLAVRNAPGPGHLGVVLQDLQHLLAGRRALGGQRAVEGAQHVGLELQVGADAKLLDRVDDGADVDVSHDAAPGMLAIAAWARRAISLGGTSSLCVAKLHWLPNGSEHRAEPVAPEHVLGDLSTLHPASVARLNALSTSRT